MSAPLTATMVACIDMAQEAGGELIRFQGGFWAPRGEHPQNRMPSHSTPTVNGVVNRGFAEYTEWRDGRNGKFPIAMRLIEQVPA